MEPDRTIATFATRQHGLVTLDQLRESGLTERGLGCRTEAGRLERLHRSVYRVAGSVHTFEQEVLAACLSVGGLVAASHRAAAELWDLELPDPPRCEITRAPGRSPRLQGVIVHRVIDLVPGHIVVRRGIPVTNPMRLLVDLGAVVPPFVVEHALDDLVGRRVVSLAGVRAFHESVAARGRSGVGVLRAILERRADGDEMSRSRLEAMLIDLADRAGLPTPVFQHPIVLGGRNRRIDFAFPALRIAIEVDGYESHMRYDVFQDDRVRGNELELAGWVVLHFTWHQVRHRPAYVVGVLRRALALAAAADAAA
ncbi:MAG: type IV toxin-antitoxin system AbiEi family antitoxin domain-containing protein [Acidimicrobiales bacterium]